MRQRFAGALVTLVVIAGSAFAEETIAPDWSLATSDGQTVTLGETVAERPVILFFWASWCPFCKALMPHLQSIDVEYGDSIEILALNIRDDGNPEAFLAARGYAFTLLPAAESVAEGLGVHATPGVVIVDRDRAIRFDLYDLPRPDVPEAVRARGREAIAAYLSAYWAAEIRGHLDEVL